MSQQPQEGRPLSRRRRRVRAVDEAAISRPKLSAGDQAFDSVLGGGIPRDSLYIVAGPPGAGKTIMAQQFAFAAAKAGLHVIYFTNVSEPHAKLVEHIRGFDFYDPDIIGDKIQIYNITSQVRDKGLRETLDFIVSTVRSEQADLVVVDSFRGLKHVLEVSVRDRGAIFDLAAQLSILGCTTMLVGEYTPYEMQTDPEFAVADGIINLWHATSGVQERRTLRIAKMRGVRYLGGEHSFQIGQRGIHVFPRQESLTQAPSYRSSEERISMGIPALDEMMFGGPIRSSSTLVAGSAGTGKTVLSLHFLAAGVRKGERGLMVSFQENPEQLETRASHFGLKEQLGFNERLTEVLSLSPVELELDAAAAHIRSAVEARGVRRVVIDSVAELEFAVSDPERFDDFLASLVGFLRANEVTTLMTREIPQLFSSELTIASRGLSYIVDNIVLLRYIELRGQIRRALAVVKSRGSDHDKSLRDVLMSGGAVHIGERFENLAGLMTGMPRISASYGTSETAAGGRS
jgi:circadian clock protein KaiC